MKLLASGAAVFFWIQTPLCALEGFGVHHELPHAAGAATHAHEVGAAEHGYKHTHTGSSLLASSQGNGSAGHEPLNEHSGNEGADHCTLLAQALTSTPPASGQPAAVSIAAMSQAVFLPQLRFVQPGQDRERAPPRTWRDLVLRHATLLL